MSNEKKARPRRKCYYWISVFTDDGGILPDGRYGRYLTVKDAGFIKFAWKGCYANSGHYHVDSMKKLRRIIASLPGGVVIERLNNTRRGRIVMNRWVTSSRGLS